MPIVMTVMLSSTAEPRDAIESREPALDERATPDSRNQKRTPQATVVRPPFRLADRFWYRRSVRVQLLATFVAIEIVAALIAGAVTIVQARKSTRVEIAASLRMAEILVGETAELLQQELPAEQFLANLPAQLRFVRHLRITVRDASG